MLISVYSQICIIMSRNSFHLTHNQLTSASFVYVSLSFGVGRQRRRKRGLKKVSIFSVIILQTLSQVRSHENQIRIAEQTPTIPHRISLYWDFFLLVDTDSISSTAFNSSSSEPQLALQEKVAGRPPRNPPTNIFGQVERRIAEGRNQLRNRNQDQNIPFAQDEEFIRSTRELLPMCVYLSRTVENGTFKLRTFDWEQQRYFSVYLASIKRETIC